MIFAAAKAIPMTDRDNTFVVGRIVTRGINERESKNVVTRREIMKTVPTTVYNRAKANELKILNHEVNIAILFNIVKYNFDIYRRVCVKLILVL